MRKDEKPVVGKYTKKLNESKSSDSIANKESIGRNKGNVIKPADVNALKKGKEGIADAVLKNTTEKKGKTWVSKMQKQETQQPQSQQKPSALQQKAQQQLTPKGKVAEKKAPLVKQEVGVKPPPAKSGLQQKAKAHTVAAPKKEAPTKATPAKSALQQKVQQQVKAQPPAKHAPVKSVPPKGKSK